MTTCRDFATRRQRASAGLQPRRSPVIGSFAAVGWNAAGIPKPTRRRPAFSMNRSIPRQVALPGDYRSSRVTWHWWDEQRIATDVGEMSACLIVFTESKWPLAGFARVLVALLFGIAVLAAIYRGSQ
jgi:hypothetical protein